MKKHIIRVLLIVVGTALILTVYPPASLHVMNVFVLLPALIGILLILFPVINRVIKHISGRRYKTVLRALISVICVICIFFVCEFIVVFKGSFAQNAPDGATAIVLGAKVSGVHPSLLLEGRIKAAGKFLTSHPHSSVIASGGKGPGERISEAQCIKNELEKQFNISDKRIYMEDKSEDTQQNFANSLKIIKQQGLSETTVVVTDGFHMFRSKLIARRMGLTVYSCPAKTDRRLAPTFYLRELFALPKSFVFD